MLKNTTKIVAIFIAIILLFSTTFVFADNEENLEATDTQLDGSIDEALEEEHHEHDETEIKNEDVYIIQKDPVTIDYAIDGNLYVIANDVTINSQVNGDAFIMAKNLTVGEEGYIYSNLFAMASNIDINGVVFNLYSLSQNLTLGKGYVYRDAKSAANTITFKEGIIGRDAAFSCSNIYFNKTEEHPIAIYGNLAYSSNNQIEIPDGAVSGEVKYDKIEIKEVTTSEIITGYIVEMLQFAALVVIVWLICLWLAPKFVEKAKEFIGKSTLKTFGIGFLALIAIPVISLILILLQITIQPAFLLMGIYVIALFIAKSLALISINNCICSKLKIDKTPQIGGMLVASSSIAYVLFNLPYIGGLLTFVVFIFGLGVLTTSVVPKKEKVNIEKK